MKSDAGDVAAYLREAPAERRDVLEALRALCHETLDGFEESMQYGMATYSRAGVPEVAWASQKQYISVYVMRSDVLEAHRPRLDGANCGKGCVRYRTPDRVDLDVVRSMLAATSASRGPVG